MSLPQPYVRPRRCLNGTTHQLRERAGPGTRPDADALELVRKADQRVVAELYLLGPARRRIVMIALDPGDRADAARALPGMLRRPDLVGLCRVHALVMMQSGRGARRPATSVHAARLTRQLARRLTRLRRHAGPASAGIHPAVPADYGTSRTLAPQREPRMLLLAGLDVHRRELWLAPRAAAAWSRMRAAAHADGVELQAVSGFRSIAYQAGIVQRKLARGQSLEDILKVSAAPGFSEHHSGRALDLTAPGFAALEEEFEHSPAFAWLSTQAQHFGFRLSFPRDNPHGIAYEPWHWYFAG